MYMFQVKHHRVKIALDLTINIVKVSFECDIFICFAESRLKI